MAVEPGKGSAVLKFGLSKTRSVDLMKLEISPTIGWTSFLISDFMSAVADVLAILNILVKNSKCKVQNCNSKLKVLVVILNKLPKF
jgi:hypothetical protein